MTHKIPLNSAAAIYATGNDIAWRSLDTAVEAIRAAQLCLDRRPDPTDETLRLLIHQARYTLVIAEDALIGDGRSAVI